MFGSARELRTLDLFSSVNPDSLDKAKTEPTWTPFAPWFNASTTFAGVAKPPANQNGEPDARIFSRLGMSRSL